MIGVIVGVALTVWCARAAECDDGSFDDTLRAFEKLAASALERGLTRRQSIDEIQASGNALAQSPTFYDVYPVVFQRAALERKKLQE